MNASKILLIALTTSLQLAAQKSMEYVSKADSKFASENYSGAVQDYTTAIKKDDFGKPDITTKDYKVLCFLNRGMSNSRLGNFALAITDFNKANELNEISKAHKNLKNSTKATLYLERGYAKYKIDDLKGAIKDYDLSLSVNPQSKEAKSKKLIAIEALKK